MVAALKSSNSMPSRSYFVKCSMGDIEPAVGAWAAMYPRQMRVLLGGDVIPKRLVRTCYLLRVQENAFEIYSTSYCPLAVIPLNEEARVASERSRRMGGGGDSKPQSLKVPTRGPLKDKWPDRLE